MAAKDKYHEHVKEALMKDGWTITHDPYVIKFGKDKEKYEVDFGAEKIIAAQKGTQKIAIEVKSFLSGSVLYDYHAALGQYLNYKINLDEFEADRILFIAMPQAAYKLLSKKKLAMKTVEKLTLKIFTFDIEKREIVQWIK